VSQQGGPLELRCLELLLATQCSYQVLANSGGGSVLHCLGRLRHRSDPHHLVRKAARDQVTKAAVWRHGRGARRKRKSISQHTHCNSAVASKRLL
jgi:hypothetical protein